MSGLEGISDLMTKLHNSEVLTADEAAELLRLSRKAFYLCVSRGQIPVHRLGERRLRFLRHELLAMLGNVAVATPGGFNR